MKVLDGKIVAENLKKDFEKRINDLKVNPNVAVLGIKGDEASGVYIKRIQKNCEKYKIGFNLFLADTEKDFKENFGKIKNDNSFTGIMFQQPLSKELSELINEVPSNKEKQEHWNNQVNYLEKDSRGLYIMSDLTCNKSNNILDRMYAARTLIKIKKDLESIGRRVLHEYNDSLVQARLMAECDAYLSTWLQNGALSSAYVDIIDYTRRPSLSDTELVVAINVKFKNTIDVVPFEITL